MGPPDIPVKKSSIVNLPPVEAALYDSQPAYFPAATATRILISLQGVFRVLLLIVVTLTLASVVGNLFSYYLVADDFWTKEMVESYIRLFSLDREANIPTWFSSAILFCSSVLLAMITVATKTTGGRYFRHWGALALIFLYLSLDEAAEIHEMAIKPLRLIFQTSGLLYYAWIIPAAICTGIFALAYLRFLMHLPSQTRWLFTAAGVLYVGGAIGVEALSGQHAEQYGEAGIIYDTIITVEELLEMLGIAVFVYALLDYMKSQLSTVELHITSR